MLRPASRSDDFARSPRGRLAPTALVLAIVLALAACASGPKKTPVAEPATLKSIEGRQVAVAPDQGVDKREETAAVAYKDFLKAAPRDPNRQEALRRLGDLEMDRVDSQAENAGTPKVDYGTAIKQYLDFLKSFPNDPNNDRVLYQLARAYASSRRRSRRSTASWRSFRSRATSTKRSSVAAKCCSRCATTPRPSRRTPPRCRAAKARRTTNARSTCTAGRCSSRHASRTA
jgi:hypothetical protein